MSDHPFDAALQLTPQEHGAYGGHTSEAYWNSISPFGGITVALVLRALEQHPQRIGDPLALTVNFAGAIQPGPLSIRCQPLRTGRSTQHWSFTLVQDSDPAPLITGSAVFASGRGTWQDDEAQMPAAPAPESTPLTPPLLAIPFLQRYAIRYVGGSPLRGGASSMTRSWISDEPPRPLDFASLAAFCDAFVPRLFVRKGAPSPVSTVSMSIHFHVDCAQLAAQHATTVFTESRAHSFSRGYYDQLGLLWAPSGKLLASTTQMVWYRDSNP